MDVEGVSIEDFSQMNKDDIFAMFKLISHHGETVRAEVKVSAVAQSNFMDLCYFLSHHLNWVDHKTTHTEVLLTMVKKMKFQCQQEMDHTNLTVRPTLDTNNCPKTMESLEIYIKGHQVGDKGLLSYMI